MSFIARRRLFANEVKPSMLTGYVLDLVAALVLVCVILVSLPDLRQFGRGAAQVSAAPASVALIGFLFSYGIRLSTYVAMIRRNRAPQVLEWWCMLLGITIPLLVWLLDGLLLRSYAALHGYGYCHTIGGDRIAQYLFARAGSACPV